jgi:predicted nucleic acid-binding protein
MALAAALSATGASRQVFDLAPSQNWELFISPWVLREMNDNLVGKPAEAKAIWQKLRAKVTVEDDVLTFDWPLVFDVTKDKPVLCTALACADVLLTLDRRDFGSLLGQTVYDLLIQTPGAFLRMERESGRLMK